MYFLLNSEKKSLYSEKFQEKEILIVIIFCYIKKNNKTSVENICF